MWVYVTNFCPRIWRMEFDLSFQLPTCRSDFLTWFFVFKGGVDNNSKSLRQWHMRLDYQGSLLQNSEAGWTLYRVSQQVWNNVLKLRNECERSEHRLRKLQKICILLHKIAFSAFFLALQKWKWLFKANYSYAVIYEVNWKKKCFKKPFSFLQFTKKAEKAVFWSEIHIFW